MKKVIITGAGGLLGLSLLTILDSSKYEVIAIDKNKNNLQLAQKINPGIKVFYADLAKEGEWESLFKKAFCVIQMQAQISDPHKEPYILNNIDSVENVTRACEKNKIKHLIHLSSSVVMSVAKDNYSNTKTKGEEIVKKSNAKYTILRPPLMYGAFDIKHMGFLTKLLDKSPIFPVPGKGDYIRQPLYANDLANIIIRLIERKPEKKIYNIIGKEKITFLQMLKTIAKKKKKKILFIRIPIPVFLMLLKIHNLFMPKKPYVPSQLKALIAGDIFHVEEWEKEFDVRYTPYEAGVKDMIDSDYYKYRYVMTK
jgi:nucleoside-diphosphate-sugar epimerase